MALGAGLTVLGLALTGLFAGLETGLYTLNPVRLIVAGSRGSPAALRLRGHLRAPNRTLIVLLVGTNTASYLGSYGLARLLHDAGLSDQKIIILEAMIFTPLVFVFAEILPKDLFRTHTDRWTYALAPVVSCARWLFTFTGLVPVVQLVATGAGRLLGLRAEGTVTARQRISQLIREGVGAGLLSESQTSLADRALAMRDRTVGGECVPWSHVETIPIDADRATREAQISRHRFTRLPVVDRGGAVVGTISLLEAVLHPERTTVELTRPAIEFAPGTRVSEALRVMRTRRHVMAIVTGPGSRRPAGLVTLKDLIEPLTGELAAW
jgi:CBS domain containing-hemolysin-like protein